MTVLYRGERVRVEGDGGYREVWLTRPEKRNALDVAMRDELFEALGVIAVDESVSAVGLLGEGPDFCAGGDLDEFGTAPDPVTAFHVRVGRSLPLAFLAVAPKLVAGLHGSAVGAGLELAAFARTILSAHDACFRLPELGMGLLPGSGGTVSVTRRVGPHRMLELALSGRLVDAEEARAWGLVDEVVARDNLIERVRKVAAA